MRLSINITNRPLFSLLIAGLLVLGSVAQTIGQDQSERPPTQDLLPETTVAFVQVDDIRDFMTKMSESSVGEMMRDEAVAPLVDQLWGEAQSAYADYEDQIGVSLEDLQAFPGGEMTFAVIAPRRKNPEFMLILEVDEESEAVDRVLERGRDLIRNEGGQDLEIEQSDDGIEFESFMVDQKRIKFFRKDGLLVGGTSEDELNAFIDRWMGREVEKVRPLSENRKFITIMNRCLGESELKPEARFYVDPIAIAKSATRGNFAAQASLAFLPVVGLDGLLGIGGSTLMQEEGFASIAHMHILLANPRSGIFEMLAFKPTDYEPEPWLPAGITQYFTTSWDVDQMFAELTKMIESFQPEGSVDEWIENNINAELELDAREEILGAFTGRITYLQWMEPPMRINSQVNVFALELKDPSAFEETLDKIIERINRDQDEDDDDRIEFEDYKGVRIIGPSQERIQAGVERRRERLRERGRDDIPVEVNIPSPSFALVGDYFIISPQSRAFTRLAIDVDQGESEALRDSEEYLEIADKMRNLLGTDMPSGMVYARPIETFRWLFELARSEDTQNFLATQAEENQYVGGIKAAMDENPIPEFEELEKYFVPQGGFMTSDETGLHMLFFELERKIDDDE